MDLSDVKPGMKLSGTVRNVVDFGAFVDIGVHQDGLVHVSQITDRYIRHPSEVLSVGDIVEVTVLSVDPAKKRISLTMREQSPSAAQGSASPKAPRAVRIFREIACFFKQTPPQCTKTQKFQLTPQGESWNFLLGGKAGLVVLRVALAHLELVGVLEHVQHRHGLLAGELLEVVGPHFHLALADGLAEGHHAVGGVRGLAALFEVAVGGAGHAHGVETPGSFPRR